MSSTESCCCVSCESLVEAGSKRCAHCGTVNPIHIAYYHTTPLLYFSWSFLGQGYVYFWMYENWCAVQSATGRYMSPFLRGFFPLLCSYELFGYMRRSAKYYLGASDYKRVCWSTWIYSVCIVISNLFVFGFVLYVMFLPSDEDPKDSAGSALLVLFLLILLVLNTVRTIAMMSLQGPLASLRQRAVENPA